MRLLILVCVLSLCGVGLCETRRQFLERFAKNMDDSTPLSNPKWRPTMRKFPSQTRLPKGAPKNEILDEFLEAVVDCYGVLGMTVGVVHEDQVVFTKGYGVRSIDPPLPVTENTLFGIGSTTKAFTSTLLAMYEDVGLIDWDAPIGDIFPQVELEDEYATRMLSLRDMTAHKSGLSRNDMYWLSGPTITREEFVEKTKFWGMNLQFRREWQYNNIMWANAGFAGADVLDSNWEDEIINRILQPLGMDTATPFVDDALGSGNYALPYGISGYDDDGEPQYIAMPPDINKVIELLNPAGGISASALDMVQWIRFQLNRGALNSSQLISREALGKTLLRDMSISPYLPAIVRPLFPVDWTSFDYGLGWEVGTYRGHLTHSHSGGTLGHSTWLWMIRDAGFGIFFSAIGDSLAAITVEQLAATYAADLYLGFNPWLDIPTACNFPCDFIPCDSEPSEFNKTSNVEVQQVSKEVADQYVGVYNDDGWGDLIIDYDETLQVITWNFNRIEGNLIPLVNPDLTLATISGDFVSILGPGLVNPFQFGRSPTSERYESVMIFDFEPTLPPTFIKQ